MGVVFNILNGLCMLTVTQITKYGILAYADIHSKTDHLFSGEVDFGEDGNPTWLDPIDGAHESAGNMGAEFYDINVAICKDNKCVVQILVFRTKEGYERYKEDGVIIFNDSE